MRFDPTIQTCLPLKLFFLYIYIHLVSSFVLFMAGIAGNFTFKVAGKVTHGPQALFHPLLTLGGMAGEPGVLRFR